MNKLLYLAILIVTLIYNLKSDDFRTTNKVEYLSEEIIKNINNYNKKKISLNNINYTVYYTHVRPRRITSKRNIY